MLQVVVFMLVLVYKANAGNALAVECLQDKTVILVYKFNAMSNNNKFTTGDEGTQNIEEDEDEN